MYMDKELIEDKINKITDQFNERKITTFLCALKQNTSIL